MNGDRGGRVATVNFGRHLTAKGISGSGLARRALSPTSQRRVKQVPSDRDVRLQKVPLVRHDGPRKLVLSCTADSHERGCVRKLWARYTHPDLGLHRAPSPPAAARCGGCSLGTRTRTWIPRGTPRRTHTRSNRRTAPPPARISHTEKTSQTNTPCGHTLQTKSGGVSTVRTPVQNTLICHTLAISQVVFLCVGRWTWPNCVSYVALSLWIFKGSSTVTVRVSSLHTLRNKARLHFRNSWRWCQSTSASNLNMERELGLTDAASRHKPSEQHQGATEETPSPATASKEI